MNFTGKTYADRVKQQGEEWAKGNSYHNDIDNECCPDFSCCKPELKASDEQRQVFINAPREVQEKMLYTFLGSLCGSNVAIIDGDTEHKVNLN